MRRTFLTLTVLILAFLASATAEGGDAAATGCGVQAYSYAGLQAANTARGIQATLTTTSAPDVLNGHVGGWIGLGGTQAGPGGTAEWIQTGLAAFSSDSTSQIYYEVTTPGQDPQYVEVAGDITAGASHRFSVLEIAHKPSWWRVWVDDQPVSPPIHLPGSDNTWYPQAVAENWNGGTGACNTYSYRFSDVSLARSLGGAWRPLQQSSVFQDTGYRVVPISQSPRTFLAASVA